MPRYERNSTIKVLNNEYLVSDLLNKLVRLPSEEVLEFFNSINLNFNRELRITVLKDVLVDKVKETRRERASLADEMNYRLSWFNQFTESQLVNLFNFYKNETVEVNFLEELWLSLIEKITDKRIDQKDFDRLIQSATEAHNKDLVRENVVKYNETLDSLFYDDEGKIDGLTPEEFRPVLYKSSTMTEIRAIGKKHGVNVPSRLKKAELLEIIYSELKKDDKYTDELAEKLRKMNVILIQRFAIDNNIKASTELKKEEIIEYILKNASGTKESYYVPSDSVYEVEARDIGEVIEELPVNEEVVEEPIVEEEPIIEEVIEEPVVEEEPIVEEVVEEEHIVEEVVEEEHIVEEVVEEPVLEEVIEEPVVVEEPKSEKEEHIIQKVIVKEVVTSHHQDTRKFDPSEVLETKLNTIDYHGKKEAAFKKVAKLETSDVVEEAEETHVELSVEDTKPKRGFFGKLFRVISWILIVLILVVIALVIYAAATATIQNLPNVLVKTEDFIAKLTGNKNYFQVIRDFINGIK